MTTLTGWHNSIRTMVYDDVATPEGLTLALDNVNTAQPDDEIWLALEILDGPVRSVELAGQLRRRCDGRFRLAVYAPLNTGTRDALRVADLLASVTRTASGPGLRYGVPQARTVGRSGQHWLVVIDCQFQADEIA
jgi:hypothetical protein